MIVTVARSDQTHGIYNGGGTPWGACINWCLEAFPSSVHWTYNGDGQFEFTLEEDATLFFLRWS